MSYLCKVWHLICPMLIVVGVIFSTNFFSAFFTGLLFVIPLVCIILFVDYLVLAYKMKDPNWDPWSEI